MYVTEKTLIKRGSSEENNSIVSCQNWQKKTSDGSNDTYLSTTTGLTAVKDERYFVGYNIPQYHRRVKSGALMPQTPWRQVEIFGESEGAYSLDLNDGLTHYSKGNYCNFTDWIVTEGDVASCVPNVSNDLAQEAAAKAYSGGHDTLTFLAELTDVRHMFVSTAKLLSKLRFPRNWKVYNSQWLSARYGWRTLVYDIKDLNKAITNLGTTRKRVSERVRSVNVTSSTSAWEHEHSHYWTDITVMDTVDVGLSGSVTADISVPKFQFNPLVTGWELIPFSFVLDWFVSTGKALSALSFIALETAYAASYGYRVSITRTFTQSISRYKSTCYGGYKNQIGSCTGVIECRFPCRVPLVPHYRVRMNALKVFDLLALILQRK